MSTIPYSQIVNVIPSVLAAGGNAVDLNGLVLSTNSLAPYGQTLTFANQAAVASYFGSGSVENTMAGFYFNGYQGAFNQPSAMLFTRYPQTAISGFLRSASLASMTLTQLQALSGILTLSVAGTPFTSSTINLSSATSFSNAATIIQAAFTSPTFAVTFDSTSNAFIFTTSTTGATKTITYATGTLSAGLKLTQATGAVLSQGADAAVPGTFMDSLLVQTQNWATFTTTYEPVLTDKEAFANWSNTRQPRWLYVAYDTDATIASTPNNTATFNYYVTSNSLIGTCAIYAADTTRGIQTASALMGYAASLDFTRTNGRTSAAFRVFPGVSASVTDSVTYSNVASNGYNFYGYWGSNNPANNQNFYYPGNVSGSWAWVDTYLDQIWLNANLQLAIVQLLMNTPSVPYNAAGYSLIYAACLDPINAALNFGAIRSGVTLSAAQQAELVQFFGMDPTAAITQKGWYLQIQNAAPAVRAVRGSPPCTFAWTDGGSVNRITLASITLQ